MPPLLRMLALLLGVCSSFGVEAKKLYKFQDENGNWHFSDRSPGANIKADVSQLKVERQQRVWLIASNTEQPPSYSVRNDYPGPVEVEIGLEQNQNVKAEPVLPARFVVAPGNSPPLVRLQPIDPLQPAAYALKYRYIFGSPDARHNDTVLYQPPFDANSRFRITQGFNGVMSHRDEQNQYAVDIAMPEGTPVYAARDGVVLEVENDYYETGMKQSNLTRANNIRILHDDGSIALYAHLQLETAQVYPGQKVSSGQPIGYSGNTGFSSGPHLHFVVQINRDLQLIAVPFKFASGRDVALEPVEGMWLSGVGAQRR